MMPDKDLTDDVLDEIIAGAKTSIEQYLALSLKAERSSNRQQSAQQNIPEIIPGGLVEAVNNLLNNDGSRGRYSAIGCGEAREKIELWLAQRQKWGSQRSENLCAGNSPVIPDGLRLALSNAGIAAPESDEMLAATCEKHIQALVTWVKERKPFQPVAPQQGVK